VCGLPHRALLNCSWGFQLHHVHALPSGNVRGVFRAFQLRVLPCGEILDCIWGFELYHVHTVPCRDLLVDHGGGFRLRSLPGGGSLPGRRRGDVCGWELERGG